MSERFGLPAWLIYGTAVIQLLCVPLVLWKRYARYAAVTLSVITVGAALSHFKIGSPLTSVPALFYTGMQLWLAAHRGAVDASSAV